MTDDAKTKNKNSNDTKKSGGKGSILALGTLAAGAAAGYYFYGHKDAEEHRKTAAKWSRSFKAEVERQMQNAKIMDREVVADAVDKAVGVYERLRAVDSAELLRAARELKEHWKTLSAELGKKGKQEVSVAKRSLTSAMARASRRKK